MERARGLLAQIRSDPDQEDVDGNHPYHPYVIYFLLPIYYVCYMLISLTEPLSLREAAGLTVNRGAGERPHPYNHQQDLSVTSSFDSNNPNSSKYQYSAPINSTNISSSTYQNDSENPSNPNDSSFFNFVDNNIDTDNPHNAKNRKSPNRSIPSSPIVVSKAYKTDASGRPRSRTINLHVVALTTLIALHISP